MSSKLMSVTISYTVKIQLGAYTIMLQNWYYSSKTQNLQPSLVSTASYRHAIQPLPHVTYLAHEYK